MEKDYLDELIEEHCKDPAGAAMWAESEARLELARLRREAGMTQQEVADAMGVPQPRVAEIERHPGRVSLARLQKYVAAVGGTIRIEPKASH